METHGLTSGLPANNKGDEPCSDLVSLQLPPQTDRQLQDMPIPSSQDVIDGERSIGQGSSARAGSHKGPQDLVAAVIKSYQDPLFSRAIHQILSHAGLRGVTTLWSACETILDSDRYDADAIVRTITRELAKYHKQVPENPFSPPPLGFVSKSMLLNPDGIGNTLEYFADTFHMNQLHIVGTQEVLRGASSGFLLSFCKKQYATLVQDSANHEILEALIRRLVLNQDVSALETCAFIRDRYESTYGWSGRKDESTFLWHVRDRLTTTLLKSPLACEGNFKISLMFPREVPHPALDCEPQRILNVEHWLMSCTGYLGTVFGFERVGDMRAAETSAELDSSMFIYVGFVPEARIRGVHELRSKFDRESDVLLPLARALGVELFAACGQGPSTTRDCDLVPRSWLSTDDEVRYRQSQIVIAARALVRHYYSPEAPKRARHSAQGLLWALVKQHPYAVAQAAPLLRKIGGAFHGDLSRIVLDNAAIVWRKYSDSSEGSKHIRENAVLMDAFGYSHSDMSQLILRELSRSLDDSARDSLNSYEVLSFIGSMRQSCFSNPEIEERAARLIREQPDTPAASLMARYLFEVRCPDIATKGVVLSQARRADLKPNIWVNYAHAAVGLGADAEQMAEIRNVFDRRHGRALRAYSRWNLRVRAAYRMIFGSVRPDRVGDIAPLRNDHNGLVHSSLERRVVDCLEEIPGVRVYQKAFIPWAPALDGVLIADGLKDEAIVLLIDGEPYHSVNGSWGFRGFDGHSLLVKNILVQSGYTVMRISAHFGKPETRVILKESVATFIADRAVGRESQRGALVIDPPDDYSDILNKVIVYRARSPRPFAGEASLM